VCGLRFGWPWLAGDESVSSDASKRLFFFGFSRELNQFFDFVVTQRVVLEAIK